MGMQLSGSHRTTYEAIVGHPAPQTLPWRNVRSMLGALADVLQVQDGIWKVTRNGQTLALAQPYTTSFADAQELLEIRRFLEESDTIVGSSEEWSSC